MFNRSIAQYDYSMVAGRVVVTNNNFAEIASGVQAGVAGKMRTGMMNFLIIADRITPVDKGLLKANKTIEVPKLAFGMNPRGKIIWNQEYAIYQEFGTVHVAGKHFASRAATLFMGDYVKSFNGVFTGGSIR